MGEEKIKEEWPETRDQIKKKNLSFYPLHPSPSHHVSDKKLHHLDTLTIWESPSEEA